MLLDSHEVCKIYLIFLNDMRIFIMRQKLYANNCNHRYVFINTKMIYIILKSFEKLLVINFYIIF